VVGATWHAGVISAWGFEGLLSLGWLFSKHSSCTDVWYWVLLLVASKCPALCLLLPPESFVQWSPQGNYIATMHRKGVALWGGPGYARLQRYSHDDVKLIEFSPAERYLMTYSQIRPNSPHEKLQLLLNVFETRSGRKLRIFSGNLDEYACEWVGGRQLREGGSGSRSLTWACGC
jgi:hypothetical protein